MQTFNLDQFEKIAEKLNAIQKNVFPQGDDYIRFERASAKLQSALVQFKNDPANPGKSKSFLHALSTYKTACEIFIIKKKTVAMRTKALNTSFKSSPLCKELADVLNDEGNH